ncbi:MAG: hypothetical protein BWZ10_01735 [candidate division BRC1 bacterium ADurb.BinA364]|nr:MAG: hypothetical protein BWZ10_01735 [candidate division BRC1 bacterium ADurb.BinA364]
MKQFAACALAALFASAIGSTAAWAAETAPQGVIEYANQQLVKLGEEAAIVKAVQEANAKGLTLEEIKKIDEKWQATPGIDDFMKSLMESECGKFLAELTKKTPFLAEIFVMDNQGANVALNNKTSDFWQGDEPKFTESYKDGNGAVHFSNVEFDDSTQAYMVQISVPVRDPQDKTKAIGAICVGVDLDKFDELTKK